MPILTQKTISKEINFTGVGIHTGVKTNLKLIPALPNTGIKNQIHVQSFYQ